MEQYLEFEGYVRSLYEACIRNRHADQRKALLYFERFNSGEIVGLDYLLVVCFEWFSNHLDCAIREIVLSEEEFSEVDSFVKAGFIEDFLLLVGDLVNDHILKYVKKYGGSGSSVYSIMASYFLGSCERLSIEGKRFPISTSPRGKKHRGLADKNTYRSGEAEWLEYAREWRLELLKMSIVDLTRSYVNSCKERASKAREAEERKKYANEAGNSISNRLEPILKDAIDYISDEVSSRQMEGKDVVKLLSSVLTPLAKMRGELKDGIEITSNNVFYKLTQAAENERMNSLMADVSMIDGFVSSQIEGNHIRLLEEME